MQSGQFEKSTSTTWDTTSLLLRYVSYNLMASSLEVQILVSPKKRKGTNHIFKPHKIKLEFCVLGSTLFVNGDYLRV